MAANHPCASGCEEPAQRSDRRGLDWTPFIRSWSPLHESEEIIEALGAKPPEGTRSLPNDSGPPSGRVPSPLLYVRSLRLGRSTDRSGFMGKSRARGSWVARPGGRKGRKTSTKILAGRPASTGPRPCGGVSNAALQPRAFSRRVPAGKRKQMGLRPIGRKPGLHAVHECETPSPFLFRHCGTGGHRVY